MLILFWLIVSMIATGVTSYFISVNEWIEFWIPLVLLIGYFVAVAALYFAFAYIFGLLTIRKNKEYKKISKFHAFLFDITLAFLFHAGRAKIHVIGDEKIPAEPSLFVYNHRSKFDSLSLSVKIKGRRMIQISKPENKEIPIAGEYMHRNCFLTIDRENPRNAMKTINKAAEFIKEQKYNVGVAPEGTRNKGEGLLPFRDGCLKIAHKAECPIVICKMYNMEKICKNFPFKRTHVYLYILDVLKYDDIKDLKTFEISDIIRSKMLEHENKLEK
jgi:1-acyl-sn-glycerol-3-phosphate acyltransferase